jgi:molecular chaperone Hsp33
VDHGGRLLGRTGWDYTGGMSDSRALVQRALSSDSQVRFAVLDASPLWDGVRRGHPQLEAGACASLVELLSAALLLQSRTFFSERLQLLLKGSGRARAVVADAWPDGSIRGILDPRPERAEGPWVAAPGLLNVMRSSASGPPYVGSLDLVAGDLQAQIEAYLLQSEQVQASLTLWCEASTGEAGGLLVEPMPGCPPERLAQLVHAVEGLEVVPLPERTPAFLCEWVNKGEGVEILCASDIRYHCRCSRESLARTLTGFGKARLEELFVGDEPLSVTCDYCGKVFSFTREDLPGAVL